MKGKLVLGRFRATIPWLAKLSRRAPGSPFPLGQMNHTCAKMGSNCQ
jgi:hypothetical protein